MGRFVTLSSGSAMSSDIDQLRELAGDVRGMADEVRTAAGRLREALGVEFVSKAADRYREDVGKAAGRADATAEELMQASSALLNHAAEVEERLRQIEAVERWFADRLSDARGVASGVADVADHALDSAQREASRLIEAARQAPPPGSPDWLDFARRFRR